MIEFYEGMSEILEANVKSMSPSFDLHSSEASWDSLAIVSTIALVDDCFGVMLDGKSLGDCKTIADIENLINHAKKS